MKKLFEIEVVTHRMAAILKTDLYSKLEQLEHWKLSLRCANANSISRRRKQKTENRKQIIRDLRHLTFQVSVIIQFYTEEPLSFTFIYDPKQVSWALILVLCLIMTVGYHLYHCGSKFR